MTGTARLIIAVRGSCFGVEMNRTPTVLSSPRGRVRVTRESPRGLAPLARSSALDRARHLHGRLEGVKKSRSKLCYFGPQGPERNQSVRNTRTAGLTLLPPHLASRALKIQNSFIINTQSVREFPNSTNYNVAWNCSTLSPWNGTVVLSSSSGLSAGAALRGPSCTM